MKRAAYFYLALFFASVAFSRTPFSFWGSAAAPFSPSTPGNLVLWVEADSLVLSDSDPVAAWADQSAQHNDFAQGTSANRPLYKTSGGPNSLPYVLGDGVNDSLLTADTASLKLIGQAATLVFIFKTTASDGWAFTHYNGSINNGWATRLLTHVWFLCDSGGSAAQFAGAQYTINDGNWHIAAIRWCGGFATTMVDGLPDKSFPIDQPFSGGDPSSNPLSIVTSAAGAQLFNTGSNQGPLAGGIYGALAYGKSLSNVELKKIFDYYHTKCATTSSADTKPYIQFVGDSMYFYPGVPGGGTCVPDQAMALLPGGAAAYSYDNFASVGATIPNLNSSSTWQYWQYCLAHGNKSQVACFNGGSNDLATGGKTPAQALTALKAYCAGFKAMFPAVPLIVRTVTPRSDGGISVTFEVDRQTLNAAIRAQTLGVYWDGVADVGNDPTIGQAGDSDNLTYYDSSKVHFTPAGAAIDAGIESAEIIALMPH